MSKLSRLISMLACVLTALQVWPWTATAYELTLVRDVDASYDYVPSGPPGVSDPSGVFPNALSPGDLLSFSLYLDTEGQSGIVGLSVGLTFESAILGYRPDLSDAEDYYPLYAPAIVGGKAVPGTPATYLIPVSDPPSLWAGASDPDHPQLNVEFMSNQLYPTTAVGSNVFLARLVFEVADYGDYASGIIAWDEYWSPIDFGFDHPNTSLLIDPGTGFIDVGDQVGTTIAWAPEPSTSILVGLGLALLSRPSRKQR